MLIKKFLFIINIPRTWEYVITILFLQLVDTVEDRLFHTYDSHIIIKDCK